MATSVSLVRNVAVAGTQWVPATTMRSLELCQAHLGALALQAASTLGGIGLAHASV